MQVTMLTKAMPPALTGGDIYVEHLARAMRALVQTHVWSVSPCQPAAGNPSISSPAPRYGIVGAAPGLPPSLEDIVLRNMELIGQVLPTEILHAHTWYSFLAAAALKRRDHCPLVITLHSLDVMRVWKTLSDPTLLRFTTTIELLAVSVADQIIVPSQATRADLIEWIPSAEIKTLVIPSGVDESIFRPEAETDPLLILPERLRDYMLVSARVSRQKDWELALDVVKQISEEIPVVFHLGTTDDPRYATELRTRIFAICELRNNLHVLDDHWLSASQMATLFARSRVFLCTSLYETFGLVLAEAMACGVPVVSTAFPAAAEVLGRQPLCAALGAPTFERLGDTEYRRGVCAVLSQEVSDLFASPSAWRSAREQSLRRAQNFSWRKVAEAHVGLYRKLLCAPPGPP